MRMHFAFLAISMLLLALPVSAQDTTAENPLLDMLRYVPDHVDNRNWIQYGDLEAWYESWGIERIPDHDALLALRDAEDTDFLAFAQVMPYQTLPPEALGLQYLLAEDMRSAYGFDIFGSNRYVQAGQPPSMISVVQSADPAESIAPALAALDYTSQPLESGDTLYSHGEDFEINIGDESLLHVGQLGSLNRIALLDGTLLIAKATHIIEKSVEAVNGEVPSLADDASYQALAAALEDAAVSNEARLTGALITTAPQVSGDSAMQLIGSDDIEGAVATLEAAQETLPPLPAYSVVAFANLHKPGTSYSVIALVFPEGTDAQAAAESIQTRLERYTSIRMDKPFTEVLADHGARIVEARGVDAGRPVALLIIADDDPTFEATDDSPLRQTAVFNFFPFITSRDVIFLTPSQPE